MMKWDSSQTRQHPVMVIPAPVIVLAPLGGPVAGAAGTYEHEVRRDNQDDQKEGTDTAAVRIRDAPDTSSQG